MKEESSRKGPKKEASVFDRGANWFVKKERGLTPSENEDLERDLVNEPELRKEIGLFEETKIQVQKLSPEFVKDMLSGDNKSDVLLWRYWAYAAVAAVLIFGLALFSLRQQSGKYPSEAIQEFVDAQIDPKTHLLPDGSLIRLNTSSQLEVQFSEQERRIELIMGEALFEVTPDENRVFVVEVDGVEIRAIGTSFNVKRSEHIDVIVTHGLVEIYAPSPQSNEVTATDSSEDTDADSSERFVTVGQRAEVSVFKEGDYSTINVFDIEVDEVEMKLDWRKSLLDVNGENLVEIAETFQQKTGYRLIIADPSLQELRIGGRFPSNDVFGFLRILQTGYGIPWEQVEDGVIVLGKEMETE